MANQWKNINGYTPINQLEIEGGLNSESREDNSARTGITNLEGLDNDDGDILTASGPNFKQHRYSTSTRNGLHKLPMKNLRNQDTVLLLSDNRGPTGIPL